MSSRLIITSVENLQDKIIETIKLNQGIPGIFVSLNKTQKSTDEIIKSHGINTDKIFYIDCVTSEKTRDDVLHVPPNRLDLLTSAIDSFVKDIKSEKFLLIDAISTLLIYNSENNVAQFVKSITEEGVNNVNIYAFSPRTKGEELLNKIFNFFDEVRK